MTDETQLRVTNEIEPAVVKPLVRDGLVILGLVGGMLLGVLLPGTGRELPGMEITLGGVVIALGTLGIVASLLFGAPTLREAIESVLIGPAGVVSAAAAIGQYFAVFLAVVLAYQGFAPVLRPILAVQWVYDLGFFLVALVPFGLMARRFYQALDPLVEFILAHWFDGQALTPRSGSLLENDHS